MKKCLSTSILLSLLLLKALPQQTDDITFFTTVDDSIVFYIDQLGEISTSKSAFYIRKAIIDSTSYNYSGLIQDYHIGGTKAYECCYKNTFLHGEVNSFFENGKIKYHGYYKESVKDSIWSYYYNNGQMDKLINFKTGRPVVKSCFKSNGKEMISNGNGSFSSQITVLLGNKEPVDCQISGNLKDGLMEGKWLWRTDYAHGIDHFKTGDYYETKGSGAFQVPRMVSLTGYDVHENVNIFKFIAIPQEEPQIVKTTIPNIPVQFNSLDFESQISVSDTNNREKGPLYKNSLNLNKSFSQDLNDFLISVINQNKITNYWCFIQFAINTKNNLEKVDIHSNNKLISQYLEKYLSSISDFQTLTRNGQNIPCNIYLSLFYANGTLNIPEYNINNAGINLLEYFSN
jgi:antitoxin component YwqK of YwqJK toxin-antitoxin module